MSTTITPYVENSFDQEFQTVIDNALTDEQFIAQRLTEISSDLVQAGTNVTAEQLDVIATRIAALSTNYDQLIAHQVRIAEIATNAAEAGQSILGYSPQDIAQQASLRESAYAAIVADFQSSLNVAISQEQWLQLSSDLSRVVSVFGQAVGPVIDTVVVLHEFSEGNDYAALSSTVSGVLGILIGAATISATSSLSLPLSIIAGFAIGGSTAVVGEVIEHYLVKYDVLDLNELSPDENDTEAVARLATARDLFTALDGALSDEQVVNILDASSGVHGEQIDAFFNHVKDFLVGGSQFTSIAEFALAIREFNFQQGQEEGFDIIDLTQLDASAINALASQDNALGQSVRYALVNLSPFASNVINATNAQSDEYALGNFSESYLADRSLMLRGYLDGLVDDTVSQLDAQGGVRVYTDTNSEQFYTAKDAGLSVEVNNYTFSSNVRGYYFGSERADNLTGLNGESVDHLYGGSGNDTLVGGEGDDYLEGGAGDDVYRFNYGAGRDVVFDVGGSNQLFIEHKEGEGAVLVGTLSLIPGSDSIYAEFDEDGSRKNNTTYVLVDAPTADNPSAQDLVVNVDGGRGGVVTVRDWGASTFAGVDDGFSFARPVAENVISASQVQSDINFVESLVESDFSAPSGSFDLQFFITPRDYITAGNDRVSGTDLAELFVGGRGSDALYGFGGNDALWGYSRYSSNPEDYRDQLTSQQYHDFVNLPQTQDVLRDEYDYVKESASSGDFLDGGAGDDVISSAQGNDTLIGGVGKDTLYGGDGADYAIGGDGNDWVLGDTEASYFLGYRATLVDSVDAGVSYDDVIDGGGGNDWLVGEIGSDVVSGGEGNDNIFGDRWSDEFFLDFSFSGAYDQVYSGSYPFASPLDVLYETWNFTFLPGQLHGDDLLSGGDGDDNVVGNGGSDSLYGEAGDDELIGDDFELASEFHQADYLYGGSGHDTLYGNGGDDYLSGGADVDTLLGGDGNDRLLGDAGDDFLFGEAGNDVLVGGRGVDLLQGEGGDDTYVFNLGDSSANASGEYDVLVDSEGSNLLRFDSVDLAYVSFAELGSGDFSIRYGRDDYLAIDAQSFYVLNGVQLGGTFYTREEFIQEYSVGLNSPQSGDVYRRIEGDAVITSSDGSDIFIFEPGNGDTTINLSFGNFVNQDVIRFASGITQDDVTIERNGFSSFVITVTLEGVVDQRITVNGYSGNELAGISFGELVDYTDEVNAWYRQSYGTGYQLYHQLDKFDIPTVNAGLRINLTPEDAQYGTAYNDTINGSDHADTILSLAGRDLVYGGNGRDLIEGGSGNDSVYGELGNDTLRGEGGNDLLYGGEGRDILLGSDGNDQLYGGTGNDGLYGGTGFDIYYYSAGDGSDVITATDTADGTSPEDTLVFTAGVVDTDVKAIKSFDNDLIIKLPDNEIHISDYFLQQGTTGFTLSAITFSNGVSWDYDDVIYQVTTPTDSDDELGGLDTDDTLSGGLGNDTVKGGIGVDVLNGNEGHDVLTGGGGNDALYGGVGDDELFGGDGQDSLSGGSGDDMLEGGLGNDILDGGAGNNHLVGEDGDDIYVISQGTGDVTINNLSSTAFAGPSYVGLDSPDKDIIRFGEGIRPEDVQIQSISFFHQSKQFIGSRVQLITLEVTDQGNTSTVTVQVDKRNSDTRFFHNHLLDSIEFSDGTVWDQRYIIEQSNYGYIIDSDEASIGTKNYVEVVGSGGDDLFITGDKADIFYGAYGNDAFRLTQNLLSADADFAEGGAGSDWYNIEGSDVKVLISEATNTTDTDILRFNYDSSITSINHVHIIAEGDDFHLRSLVDNSYIVIQDGLLGNGAGIEQYFFTGGVSSQQLSGSEVFSLLNGGAIAQDDEVFSLSSVVNINTFGLLVNDYDNHRNDSTVVAVGNALGGVATLNIATGMILFDKDDTYEGDKGFEYTIQGINGETTTAWVTINDKPGPDVIHPVERIQIKEEVNDYTGIDLSSMFDNKVGGYFSLEANFSGSGARPSWILGGRGTLSLTPTNGISRVGDYELTITAVDLQGGRTPYSILLSVVDTDVPLQGSEGNDYLIGAYYGTEILAGAGNDHVVGSFSPERIDAGTGNDTVLGGAGNDTIDGGDGDDIVYAGLDDARHNVSAENVLNGGAGDDLLYAEGRDTLNGGTGSDTYVVKSQLMSVGVVVDNQASDSESSIDRLQVILADGESVGDFTLTRLDDDRIALHLFGDDALTQSIILVGFNTDPALASPLERIIFTDDAGNVLGEWDESTPLLSALLPAAEVPGETFIGTSGDDTLLGGMGDDFFYGDVGDDRYIFSGDFGQDRINNNKGLFDNDVIEFTGIAKESLWFSRTGDDLLISIIGTNNHVTVRDWFDESNDRTVSRVTEGTLNLLASDVNDLVVLMDSELVSAGLSLADVNSGLPDTVLASLQTTLDSVWKADYQFEGNDNIAGDAGDNTLNGFAGNDIVNGLAGNDQVDGGSGNDDVFGGAGNDTLSGGEGNDFLAGGDGDDTYVFSGDFGQDRIHNYGGYLDTDTMRFDDVSASDLWFSQQGVDLLITVANSDKQVIVRNWFVESFDRKVEEIEADGLYLFSGNVQVLVDAMAATGLTAEQVAASGITAGAATNIQTVFESVWEADTLLNGADTLVGDVNDIVTDDTLQGFGGNDYLDGKGGSDVLDGGAGADQLYGGSGDDTLQGGSGDDNLFGGEGDDLLQGGLGDDYLYGAAGNDTYAFSGDFGQGRINNSGAHFDSDTIRFDDIVIQDLWFSRTDDDLLITVSGSQNQVWVRDWYRSDDPRTVQQIDVGDQRLYFSDIQSVVDAMDDSAIAVDEVMATGIPANIVGSLDLQGVYDLWEVAANNSRNADDLTGDEMANYLASGAGNDRLLGLAGSDILDGGAGRDRLEGGEGSDVLNGRSGEDDLIAGQGDDRLNGGSGSDFLYGFDGSDTYVFEQGSGQDRINNFSLDEANAPLVDVNDIALFTGGTEANELWFSQQGNDLQINRLETNDNGTTYTLTEDQVLVRNWFNDGNWFDDELYELERIETDTAVLLNDNVDQLVDALSVYTLPTDTGDVVTQDMQNALRAAVDNYWA